MTALSIEACVDQWLARHRLVDTPQIASMGTGHSHCVWRVQCGSHDWVFRLRGQRYPGYVSLHEREQAIWQLAADAGLAPALHHVSDEGGLWITDYLPSPTARIEAGTLGALGHRIHQLPAVPWTLDLREQLQHYRSLAETAGCAENAVAQDPSALATPALEEAINTLASGPVALCHNDLLPANVLGESGSLRVIDWEYAAMGSPYFDAAASLAGLPEDSRMAFLTTAFPAGYDANLLECGMIAYDALEQSWLAAGTAV